MKAVIPTIDWGLAMPLVVLMVTGLIGLLIEMFRPKQNNNLIVGVSLAGIAYTFALLFNQLNSGVKTTFSGMVLSDQFGTFAQLIILAGTALTFLFSESYLRQKRIAFGEFYPMVLWSAAGGMMMVATENLLMMFIGLELLSIALYCLAGMSRGESRSEESALKYFLLGAFASAFFLYGIAFVYGASGRIDLGGLSEGIKNGQDYLVVFGFAMILVGLGFKAAIAPFHQWTPDVYQGAPTNVTAFMSVVSKMAAFGALVRILGASFDFQELWLPAVGILAILTMTLGNLVAVVQKDAKRALGYSSIAHAGYLLVGVLAHLKMPDKISLGTVIFYFIAYMAMNMGAFAMISLTAKNGKEGTRTQDLNGMWRKAPFAAGILFLCLISLVGVPPTAGFFGKWAIFNDALAADLPILAIALAINSGISAFYYWQIAKAAFVDDEPALQTEFAPIAGGLKLTGVICALMVLGLGMGIGKVYDMTIRSRTDQREYDRVAAMPESVREFTPAGIGRAGR